MCPFNLTTLRTLNAVAAHRQGQRIAIISGDRRVHGHYVAARAFNAYARRRSTARAETQNVVPTTPVWDVYTVIPRHLPPLGWEVNGTVSIRYKYIGEASHADEVVERNQCEYDPS